MSELKLPTIRPNMPDMPVNSSGEDWSIWNSSVMSAVSEETNPQGYVGAKTADQQAQYGANAGEQER